MHLANKPKLIILPGWAGNKLLWTHQCKHLSDVCDPEVIVIDNEDTAEKMADAVLKISPEKFTLVGHSLGGWVAQHIAIRAPDRVSKLVLVGTWTGVSTQRLDDLLKENLSRLKKGDVESLLDELRPLNVFADRANEEKLLDVIKISQSKFPVKGMIKQLEVVLNGGDTSNLLSQIRCRTLVSIGRQDSFFSVEESQKMVSKIPGSVLAVIEECGHMQSIERPETVTALLRLWLQI